MIAAPLPLAKSANRSGDPVPTESPANRVSPVRKARLWLNQQLALAKGQPSGIATQVAELTPDLAQALLDGNAGNRRLSQTMVDRFASDICAGRWSLNGEPVIVGSDGGLNDGQHRCAAVVKAGTAIPVLLVLGVPRETRLTVDQGKAREAGDYLGMEGYDDPRTLGAAAGYLAQWRTFGFVSTQAHHRPSKAEILTAVRETPDLVLWARTMPHRGNVLGSPGLAAFCFHAVTEAAGRKAAEVFAELVLVGAGLSADSPVLYLRKRLGEQRSRLGVARKAELVFRAWNAHARGETPRDLPALGGQLPRLEALK